MHKLTFRDRGARQATKADLIDILCALAPDTRRDSMGKWTVDTLRAALVFAVDRHIERAAPPARCSQTTVCPYHASGGPETIACGPDTYGGRAS